VLRRVKLLVPQKLLGCVNVISILKKSSVAKLKSKFKSLSDDVLKIDLELLDICQCLSYLKKELNELNANYCDQEAKLRTAALSDQDTIGIEILLELKNVEKLIRFTEYFISQTNKKLEKISKTRNEKLEFFFNEVQQVSTNQNDEELTAILSKLENLLKTPPDHCIKLPGNNEIAENYFVKKYRAKYKKLSREQISLKHDDLEKLYFEYKHEAKMKININ